MQPIRRILVAVKDPGARSLPAVAKAAQLAHALGAEIELFHAIDTPLYVDFLTYSGASLPKIQEEGRKRRLRQLDRIAARIRNGNLAVSTAAEWDFPAHEAIIRRARRIGADLIVAERHGRRHIASWLLHVTDWELLRQSPIPVLLVKSSRPYRRPVVLAAVDPTHAFDKPARLDAEILSAAGAVSEALNGRLHAMHAYVPMPVGVTPDPHVPGNIAARIEAQAAARAAEVFDRVLRKTDIPRNRRHLVGRHPIDAIAQVARETGSAIVVMGAVSRSGLSRVFIGNTAERVLDQLQCDVLVVKPPRFASRVPRARRGVRFTAAAPFP